MKTFNNNHFQNQPGLEPPTGIEKTMVGVVFLFASGIFDPAIAPRLGFLRVNDVFIIIGAGFGVALQFTRLRENFSKLETHSLVAIFSFYAFIGLSLLWSHSPTTGVARYTGFTLTTLWTLYAATRFSLKDLITILLITLLAVSIVSAVLAVAAPSLGTMQVWAHKGDWKGVYDHKNTFGRNMALLAFISLYCTMFSGPKGLGLVGLIVGLTTLSQSGSRTAFAVCAIGLLIVFLLVLRRRPWAIVLIVLGIAIAGLTAALQALIEGNPLLQLQGESIDLFQTQFHFTGRIGLWFFSIEWAAKQPWLGYGFDGFWKVKELGGQILALEGWTARDSHNGYIDLVLQAGLVGLFLYIPLYFTFLIRSGVRMRRERVAYEDLFAGMFLFVFFFANLSESYLLKATSIYQLLATYSMVLLSKSRKPPADLIRKERASDLDRPLNSEPARPVAKQSARISKGVSGDSRNKYFRQKVSG